MGQRTAVNGFKADFLRHPGCLRFRDVIITREEHRGFLAVVVRFSHVAVSGRVEYFDDSGILGPLGDLFGSRGGVTQFQRKIRFERVGAIEDDFPRQVSEAGQRLFGGRPRRSQYEDVPIGRCVG